MERTPGQAGIEAAKMESRARRFAIHIGDMIIQFSESGFDKTDIQTMLTQIRDTFDPVWKDSAIELRNFLTTLIKTWET